MAAESESDPRPWRKRHPVLSRVILFGVGGGLIAALLVLWTDRREDDRLTELRGELISFDIVIGTPGGPDAILETLDGEFADPDLPADLKVSVLRWKAMALRRKAQAGDDAAHERVEPLYDDALAMARDPDTRAGLTFERVEFRLEHDDPQGAHAVLVAEAFPPDGIWALMREHYLAISEALMGSEAEATRRLETALGSLDAPLATTPDVVAGGRTWNLPEFATVSTERLARLFEREGRDTLPLWRRLSELAENDGPSQIICARTLKRLGDEPAAVVAWGRALRADPADAENGAKNDPELGALHALATH